MTTQGKSWTAASFIAVSLFCTLAATPASADMVYTSTVGHPEVASQLASFKQTAFALRDQADELRSVTANRQMHWRTHSVHLERLRQHVNELGEMLVSLENLQHRANPAQRTAIEQARPHLAAAAAGLKQSISLIAEHRNSVYWSSYAESINTISVYATALHESMDAILDYENARTRLHQLELLTPIEGS